MKIFKEIILNFSIEGIYWPQKYQKHPFNIKNFAILFSLGLYSSLTMLALLLEVETLSEYADAFFATVTTIHCSVMFAVLVWKTPKIFDLINSFETIIQNRESNYSLKNHISSDDDVNS